MKVPFVDLKLLHMEIKNEIQNRMNGVIQKNQFILGEEVDQFEKNFAAYCGVDHAVGVASGLDALALALRAFGVGPGDEVITAANTCMATALAVSSIGAKVVLVDLDPETFNLDVSQLEEVVTPRSRAIIPVHLYGRPVEMGPILMMAEKHNLRVLEDASHAHGASYENGKRVGTLGHAAAFSLYPTKNLGALGDAGIVTTQDGALAEHLRTLRNYGSKVKNEHQTLGANSRLDTLQAAILNLKLTRLDSWNQARQSAAKIYAELLERTTCITRPNPLSDIGHVYHLYVIRTPKRDALMKYLASKGIASLVHYPIPIHLQEAYADEGWQRGDFPRAEEQAREILSLPIFPHITREQIEYVAQEVGAFHESD
jgi:dTDP-4-amino-4,6-dideoxygalactose transaminase